ncbi:MAG: hypothetical protein IKW03_06665 [Clostridia bacterium]|nr:hypothetical protein [Clostridia bacterium]
MADYTYNDMLRMQEEAARRVREMKKRAAIVAEEDESPVRKSIPLPDDVKYYSMPVNIEKDETDDAEKTVVVSKKQSFMGKFASDKDALIIVAILSVLSQEKTDWLIILALVYILM